MKRETGFRTAVLIIAMLLCGISIFPTIMVYSNGTRRSPAKRGDRRRG